MPRKKQQNPRAQLGPVENRDDPVEPLEIDVTTAGSSVAARPENQANQSAPIEHITLPVHVHFSDDGFLPLAPLPLSPTIVATFLSEFEALQTHSTNAQPQLSLDFNGISRDLQYSLQSPDDAAHYLARV